MEKFESAAAQNLEAGETPEAMAASPLPAWDGWDWLFLLSALLAAGCYFFAHFPGILAWEGGRMPGVGLTAAQLLLNGVFLAAAKKKGRLRGKSAAGGWLLLTVSLLLGACFAMFDGDALRLMNLPVTALTNALSLFSLTGANPLPALSGRGLRLGLRRFIPSFFARWLLPVRALKSLPKPENRESLRGLGAGLLLGIPAVMLAAALLASADSVFSSMLQGGFLSLDRMDASALPRLLCTLMGGLCLFSFLKSAAEGRFAAGEPVERAASAVTLSTVLAMLAAVYALFVYIQFRYLFFGAADAVREIGYAEYARSGFFQLVLLSVLTLALILPCLTLGKGSGGVRALCALVAALTMVIDASAFFRMRLYIQAYGLSVLRVATLWGMLMILCALIACQAKCLFPDVSICPALTVLALCTWTALQLGNVDRMIARYQVNAYNSGALKTLDVPYLASLSPDVLPELERVQDEAARRKAVETARLILARRAPGWYDWSLSWLRMDQAREEAAFVLQVDLKTDDPIYALAADISQGGALLGGQSCQSAKPGYPLEGTAAFAFAARDLPGLDPASGFSVMLSLKTGPEEESQTLQLSDALFARMGEVARLTLTGSGGGYQLAP